MKAKRMYKTRNYLLDEIKYNKWQVKTTKVNYQEKEEKHNKMLLGKAKLNS